MVQGHALFLLLSLRLNMFIADLNYGLERSKLQSVQEEILWEERVIACTVRERNWKEVHIKYIV